MKTKLKSTCSIKIESDCGQLSIWDVYRDDGELYGYPALSIRDDLWDNACYLHTALEDLIQGNEETEHYLELKESIRVERMDWEWAKETLIQLYVDAVNLGLFRNVKFC